ncbi:MAG: class I SAM-dependent methyltransferase [Ruminococcus sp.]|nr:class I SAM-dependent methyltransferase [Ruminococcus sp.]
MNEEKFTGKADFYDKFRPAYPPAVADWLYEKTEAATAADIGAGTGIFTKALSSKPWKITAVEPNPDMREILARNAPFAEILSASAENTGIPDLSIDLVTAATAFHWFDKEKFRRECKRIFTPKGKLAIVWNNHVECPLIEERNRIFLKYTGMCNSVAGTASEGDDFLRSGYFAEMEYLKEEHFIDMTEEHFIGYCFSHSYSPKRDDERSEAFVGELKEAFHKFARDGKFPMPFTAECYLGEF